MWQDHLTEISQCDVAFFAYRVFNSNPLLALAPIADQIVTGFNRMRFRPLYTLNKVEDVSGFHAVLISRYAFESLSRFEVIHAGQPIP